MLQQRIAEVLQRHTAVICERVRANWGRMSGIKGNSEIHCDLPKMVNGMIVATIEAAGQKAWIAEFGSGSLADRNNPYLSSYVSSGNFNHYRSRGDMTIRGRDRGNYTDLDGNAQYSSGHNAVKDLELKPVYPVMYPAHVIQHEINEEMPELILGIQQVINDHTVAQLTMDMQIYI